jgi:pimeloyl-ACP methyl ester carboxylesterase
MKLFYRKFGDGPSLIILHGLFGSSDNWVSIAKKIGDSFTVYLPDQRNHGQSPHSDILDYDSMRDDLFEMVSELRLKKFFLAGHSMGGKTAIAFAAKWPEMIYGMLVADISPFTNENTRNIGYSEHMNILRTILSFDLSKVRSRSEAESLLSEKISSEKVRGFILKNLQRNAGDIFTWKLNALSLFNNLDKIMEGIDLKDEFTESVTGFPVIFLKGSHSNYLTTADIVSIRKVFPASEFIVINGAGHWIHADQPDEVIKNLRKLLDDH